MKNFFIESVNYGNGESGIACGPIETPVVAEAKIKDENGSNFFLSLSEICGMPNFYKSDISLFKELLSFNADVNYDEINEKYLLDIEEYSEVFEDTDNDMYELYRYLIYSC